MRNKTVMSEPFTHAGPSLLHSIEANLLEEMKKYLAMKDVPIVELDDSFPLAAHKTAWGAERKLVQQRGIVRGCAMQLLTWRNAYQKGNRDSLQALEQEFVHKLKGNGNGK